LVAYGAPLAAQNENLFYMTNVVISVESLSKSYRLGAISTGTFYGDLKRWWASRRGLPDPYLKIDDVDHGNRKGEYIWALRDVEFKVGQGEALGIIGRNGAGKSTLLKILTQVTAPTLGEIKVKGRIASLLEVGTGFHPELTGRENIFLNGAILGMDRMEVSRKLDEIVDFSGVEKFIDTPVKRYSSGMYVRLAFAVAAHLESDILAVDEVLAVGDAEFQKKCLGKMGSVAKQGRTVMFVSHNMGAIESLCQRVMYIDVGKISGDGPASQIISQYLSQNARFSPSIDLTTHPGRRPGMKPILSQAQYIAEDGSLNSFFQSGDNVTFEITLDPKKDQFLFPSISIAVFNHVGVLVCKLSSEIQSPISWDLAQRKTIRCIWPDCRLAPGRYHINFGFANKTEVIDYVEYAAVLDIHESDLYGTGKHSTGLLLPHTEWRLD